MVEKKVSITKKSRGKRVRKELLEGVVYVQATFNNTKITITDLSGNVVAWGSASKSGFKGSRKSTPFAAQVAADALAKDCAERFGLRQVHIKVKGPGPGRESAIRAMVIAGLKVLSMEDITGIPHNGCRDPKRRRV
jgi:small subunit ribosomal protein S11